MSRYSESDSTQTHDENGFLLHPSVEVRKWHPYGLIKYRPRQHGNGYVWDLHNHDGSVEYPSLQEIGQHLGVPPYDPDFRKKVMEAEENAGKHLRGTPVSPEWLFQVTNGEHGEAPTGPDWRPEGMIPEDFFAMSRGQTPARYADQLDPQEHAAFLEKINAEPWNALNHHVHADWLQDRGHDQEAAFRRAMGDWFNTHRGVPDRVGDVTGHGEDWWSWHHSPHNSNMWYVSAPGGFSGAQLPKGVPHFDFYNSQDNSSWTGTGEPAGPVQPHHGRYNPDSEVFGWHDYSDMEEAFRRSFMRNLEQQRAQPQQEQPPTQSARYADGPYNPDWQFVDNPQLSTGIETLNAEAKLRQLHADAAKQMQDHLDAALRSGVPESDPSVAQLRRHIQDRLLLARGGRQYAQPRRPLLYSHEAFQNAIRENPHDDTNWLVYADWLEENGRPDIADRMRWWAGAKAAMREGHHENLDPDTTSHAQVMNAINQAGRWGNWVRDMAGPEIARHIHDAFPVGHAAEQHAETARHAAQLHAMGLLPENEWANRAYLTNQGIQEAAEQVQGQAGWTAALPLSNLASSTIGTPHSMVSNGILSAANTRPATGAVIHSARSHAITALNALNDYATQNNPPWLPTPTQPTRPEEPPTNASRYARSSVEEPNTLEAFPDAIATDPQYIRPINPVIPEKSQALAENMIHNGWKGDPLLAVGNQALTGSHRLDAAMHAGLMVPVIFLDSGEFLDAAKRAHMVKPDVKPQDAKFGDIDIPDDDGRLKIILKMNHPVAAKIMRDEISHNDKFGGKEGWQHADWAAPVQSARYERTDYADPTDHASFQARINKKPNDAITRGVYADWLEENAPESVAPATLEFLRSHPGKAWVSTTPGGAVIAGKHWTMPEIKAANAAAGRNWFDRSNMRMFGTRLMPQHVYSGPGGVYFVHADDNFDRTAKQYQIAMFHPQTGETGIWSSMHAHPETGRDFLPTELSRFDTPEEAIELAREHAAGNGRFPKNRYWNEHEHGAAVAYPQNEHVATWERPEAPPSNNLTVNPADPNGPLIPGS